MSRVGPPQLPVDTGSHDESLSRLHFRLWQIVVTAITILITCWTFTLHPALGITVSFLGKHVLVAVLAAGFDLPPPPDEPPPPR